MATSKPPSGFPSDGTESSQEESNRNQKRVTGATAIMMVGILGSRILGLVRESVIAHQFGQANLPTFTTLPSLFPTCCFS